MSLLPVAVNRVSAPLQTQRLLFQLNNDQAAIQRQYDQLSTGRRVLRLSDDPAAASAALGYQRAISSGEQSIRNINAATAYQQSTDDALARVDNALIQARGATVQAAQNVLSESEREALAVTVRQTLDSVVAAGNSLFNDHQLLGGILSPAPALEYVDEGVRFLGTDAIGQTKTGGGSATILSPSGNDALGVASTFVVGSSLDAAVNAETRLVDLRQGLGVRPGVVTLSDTSFSVQVDLSRAATLGDVVDTLDQVELDGRALQVSVVNNAIEVGYADGLSGSLVIRDEPGSQLASDLGIANASGFNPPPIVGDSLRPRITAGTRIDDLADGAGLDLSDGFVIDRGNDRYVIDLADAETIGEVLIAINRSDAEVQAELDESSGRIRLRSLRSGVDYSVGENGGDAATNLGIRTADGETLLSDLGKGRGLRLNPSGPDVVITRPDGIQLELELEGADTINDVIDLIRNHPNNQDTRRIQVELNDVGNGLRLFGPPDTGNIEVTQQGVSDAGVRLGWIPEGEQSASGANDGSFNVLQGRDYRPRDAGGTVDTLLRLEAAIRDGDIPEIGRLQERLDLDFEQATRIRGRVGVWNQTLNDTREAMEEQTTQTEALLSDSLDADLAEVVSELSARQASMEASLRFIGQTAQLTVLNFL
ncbi:MAG: flagellar hook protein [Planctomycetota bacterium]